MASQVKAHALVTIDNAISFKQTKQLFLIPSYCTVYTWAYLRLASISKPPNSKQTNKEANKRFKNKNKEANAWEPSQLTH